MIDLHIHLLPAVDDGAASIEEARAMLEWARGLGFRTVVATPHLVGRLSAAYQDRVADAYAQTRALGAELGVDVRLGFEVQLTPDLPDRLAQGEAATLADSRAVLVDLPFAGWPHHAEATLFALQIEGFRPVLAHPERYAAVQRDPGLVLRLAERGVLLQATTGSFAGLFGRTTQRVAEHLLRRGAIHLVATDAHSVGRRYETVPDGLRRLHRLVGEQGVNHLVGDAPAALLAGVPLPEVPRDLDRMRREPLHVVHRLTRRWVRS